MTLDLLGPRSPEDQRGRHNMVSHFVLIQVISSESSAWWAVVTPDFHHKNRTVLILDLPWLHDVGAKFDIRNSELTLDIEERGDEVSTIRGHFVRPPEDVEGQCSCVIYDYFLLWARTSGGGETQTFPNTASRQANSSLLR
ncbi:hypothetical protein E4U48_004468 [Claviceps purpurea]|nr:hypothetical protein E4U48_004468 [Claviceps purpurea]